MNNQASPEEREEQVLLELYMELTEATECQARGVFMYACAWSSTTSEEPPPRSIQA
jgi:hypothetical protein